METGNWHSRERLFSRLRETLAWDLCLVKMHEVVVDPVQYHSEFCFSAVSRTASELGREDSWIQEESFLPSSPSSSLSPPEEAPDLPPAHSKDTCIIKQVTSLSRLKHRDQTV